MVNMIHNVSCIDGMKNLPEDSIDLVVTSPPYDDLRTYNDSSKWDFNVFKDVALGLVRVLKPGGVIMWNVADATVKGSETGSSFRQCLYFMDLGLRLHDTMIYEKTGAAFPSGVNSNRYTQIFEYCFILSNGKPKTSNLITDKPNKWAGHTQWGKNTNRMQDGTLKEFPKAKPVKEVGIRNNIWRVKNSKGFGQKNKEAYEHPATMPESLARDHIITWTNPGDIVLDPFSGSGTTLRMAKEEGRRYIGFEIDNEYYNLSHRLLNNEDTPKISGWKEPSYQEA